MAEKERLVSYLIDDVFDWVKSERERLIEPTWSLAYDAFRGQYSSGNLARWKELEGTDWRSKVFVRLTKVKIVAATSQIEDVYFQGGKVPFSVKPTPNPEFLPGMPMPPQLAEMCASKMQARIEDLLAECKYDRALISAVLDAGVYGMCVHKAPVMRKTKAVRYQWNVPGIEQMLGMQIPPELMMSAGQYMPVEVETYLPSAITVNPWDFYWDMEAETVDEGIACFHRKHMSRGDLYALMESPRYDKKKILQVLSESQSDNDNSGAYEYSDGPAKMELQGRRKSIEVVECYAKVPVKHLKDSAIADNVKQCREVEVIVTIAGDQVISGPILNPHPLQKRPLHVARWEELPHEIHGVGIPENMQDSQMMVNSGVRCFIDNKSLSGNLMLAGSRRSLAPGQTLSVRPGKFFELANHVQDVRQALQWFSPPDIGAGMLDLVNMFREFADMESNLPSIMQGQQERHSPKTAFAFSRLMENANKQLGKVIRNLDEGIIEPDIEALYHYEMLTNPDPSIKGDYQVQSNGFQSFKDQVVQADNLQNMLMFMLSNQMLASMTKVPELVREIARMRNLDVDRFFKSDEEMQFEQQAAMMQQLSPPPGMMPQEGMVGNVPGL